jgi:uncharacterized protein YjbJ (UPF0337 family)
MNRDRIEGKSTRLKGIVRQRWARLTADYAVDERGVAVE